MVPDLFVFMGPHFTIDSTLVGMDTSKVPLPQLDCPAVLLAAAWGKRKGCCILVVEELGGEVVGVVAAGLGRVGEVPGRASEVREWVMPAATPPD